MLFPVTRNKGFFDDFITRINAKPCTSVTRRSSSFGVLFARSHLTRFDFFFLYVRPLALERV